MERDRQSLPIEASREANSRLVDLKAALATSPAVFERPRSHTVPTKSRVPNLISRIRLFRPSKDLSKSPNSTLGNEWTGAKIHKLNGHSGDMPGPKMPWITTALETGSETIDRLNRLSSFSECSEEDATAGWSEGSDDSDSALQLVEQGQSGLTNILHQIPGLSEDGSSLTDASEQGNRAASDEEVSGSKDVEINYFENDTKPFSGAESRGVEERDVSQELTAIPMMEQQKNHDTRRENHSRAQASSFAAPTDASIEKQNAKIELHNARETPSREVFPNWPNSVEAQNTARDSVSYISRGRKLHTDDAPLERERAPLATRSGRHLSNTRISTSPIFDLHKIQDEPYVTGASMQKPVLCVQTWQKERQDLITQVELLKKQIVELEKNKNTCLVDLGVSNKEKEDYLNMLSEQLQQYEKRLDWFRQKLLRYKMRAEMRIAALEQQIVYEDTSEVAIEGARCFRLNSLYQSFDAVESELVNYGKEKEAMEAQVHEIERDRDDTVRQLETLQQELRIAQDGEQNLKQENHTLMARFQQYWDNVAEGNPRQESLTCDTLREEDENLRLVGPETRRELDDTFTGFKTTNLSTGDAEEAGKASDEVLGMFRKDIELVYDVMDPGDQTMSESNNIDWNMLEVFAQSLKAFSTDQNSPHSKFFQLLRWAHDTIGSLHNKNCELQTFLSDKEPDLSVTRTTFRRKRKDTLMNISEEPLAWQTDKDTFEKLFRDERAKRRAVEEKLQQLRENVEKQSHEDLERVNRELHIDLAKAQDENVVLHEQVKNFQARAHQWENEYNLAKTESDVRSDAFEEHIQAQQDEMLHYISEYHDKTNDPDHWRIEGLQDKVKTLERELQNTNDIFAHTKRDKARLEDEVARLMDANKRREKDIARLGRAWITGSAAPTLVDTVSSDPDDADSLSESTSSSSILWLTSPKKVDDGPKVPRCHMPLEIEKRDKIMVQFRSEQERKREEQEACEKSLEKARKEKMRPLYPPERASWRNLVKKDVWERWDE
ncbi:Nn.00g018820.m01.CDS01 [Neocucurbitaria sp. VM-36]